MAPHPRVTKSSSVGSLNDSTVDVQTANNAEEPVDPDQLIFTPYHSGPAKQLEVKGLHPWNTYHFRVQVTFFNCFLFSFRILLRSCVTFYFTGVFMFFLSSPLFLGRQCYRSQRFLSGLFYDNTGFFSGVRFWFAVHLRDGDQSESFLERPSLQWLVHHALQCRNRGQRDVPH